MRILAIVALATAVCLGAVAESQTISVSAALADVVLDWTVSPGIFAFGTYADVWTIPGTTTLTASVMDEFGQQITVGELVWQICEGKERGFGVGRPASYCQQRNPGVSWNDVVGLPLPNPPDVHPCFCMGQQIGWRLAYHGGRRVGFRSTTGKPFDLIADMNCPTRTNCP